MKKLLFILLFFISTSTLFAQSIDTLKTFSERFKMDSLGSLGYRNNYISNGSDRKTYLVDHINLKGYDKEWIIKYLGKPNLENLNNTIEKKTLLEYIVRKDKNGSWGYDELIIEFDQNNKVSRVYSLRVVY